MTVRSITIAAIAALGASILSGPGAGQAQTAPAPAAAASEPAPTFDPAYLRNPKNIKVGQEIWSNQCRHCHGASAYPGKAPKLNPGGLDPAFIYDRVTNGFGKMPPWKDVFSLEERKAVVAYIKSDTFTP